MTLWNLRGNAGKTALGRNTAGVLVATLPLPELSRTLEFTKQDHGYAVANLPGATDPVIFSLRDTRLNSQEFRWVDDDR